MSNFLLEDPDHVSYSPRDGPDGTCYNLCNLDKVSTSVIFLLEDPDHVSYSLRDGPDGMCYNLCNLDKVSTSVNFFVGGP